MTILLSLVLSLSVGATVTLACFTESPFASTCEPTTKKTTSDDCFKPGLQPSDDSGAGVSVVWDSSTGSCERRPTSCGNFVTCPDRRACWLSCHVATRGFLVLSLRAASGVKLFDLINTPSSSNGSIIGMPNDVTQLPSVFRASLLDQLSNSFMVSRLQFKGIVVTLYVGSSVALNISFDVAQTPKSITRTNWFTQWRLRNSWPVTDLSRRRMSTFNIFSIRGDHTGAARRRMFISYKNGGCKDLTGVMVALDAADPCAWGGSFTAAPKLLYSTQPSMPFATTAQSADLLVLTLH